MNRKRLKEINQKDTIHLNKLPAITWRWLKVNDFPLKNLSLGDISPYKKDFLRSVPTHGIEILPLSKNVHYLDIEKYFKDKDTLGVSKEIVKLAESAYNLGSIVHIQKNQPLHEPLWLSYESDRDNPTMIDHHLIVGEENSQCTIIMDYSSLDASPAFHNGLTRIYAKEGALINLIKIQNLNDTSLHLDSTVSFVGYGAQVNYISIELGAKESATCYVTNLEGDASSSTLDSVYFTDGNRVLDMNYRMNHFGRRSHSNITLRGALKDEAKKVFRGTLDFKKGAALSKGSEEEYALLLDPKVTCDAIPLLLCGEDNVQGQHAASAGSVDGEKLFYLMSRGLSQKEAQKMIVQSSFNPIVNKIPIPKLQKYIEQHINKRLMMEEGSENHETRY